VEAPAQTTVTSGMDTLVGYILLAGVVTSLGLVSVGVVWHWAATGGPRFDYTLPGTNVTSSSCSPIWASCSRAPSARGC